MAKDKHKHLPEVTDRVVIHERDTVVERDVGLDLDPEQGLRAWGIAHAVALKNYTFGAERRNSGDPVADTLEAADKFVAYVKDGTK